MIEASRPFEGLSVTLNTTDSCRHACKYCYERFRPSAIQKDKIFWDNITDPDTGEKIEVIVTYPHVECDRPETLLTLDKAKKFIDALLEDDDVLGVKGTEYEWIQGITNEETGEKVGGTVLDFIGGDAFQDPDLIDQILTYWCQQVYSKNHWRRKRWRASISSNGTTMLNKRAREVAEKWKNVMSLGFSIDGNERMHDANRITFAKDAEGRDIGSWYYMSKVFNWWKKNFPGNAKSTKWTTAPFWAIDASGNKFHPYDEIVPSVKYLHEDFGMNEINFNRMMENDGIETPETIVKAKKAFDELVTYVLEHKTDLHVSALSYAFKIMNVKSREQLLIDDPDISRCGFGMMPTLSCKGEVYSCFRLLPEHLPPIENSTIKMEDFAHGIVDENGANLHKNDEILKWLQENSKLKNMEIEDKCKDCLLFGSCPHCAAGDLIEGLKRGKKAFVATSSICYYHKVEVYAAIKYWTLYFMTTEDVPDYNKGNKPTEEQLLIGQLLETDINNYINTGEELGTTSEKLEEIKKEKK